jgi:NAD(P)-dependent dehydrogenase (short-subunit alcohol dehydrogenase family)
MVEADAVTGGEPAASFAADLFSVAGKTALVTGGTSGIGRMIAEGLVRGGAVVYIASRKASACHEVAAELAVFGRCTGLPGDLSSEQGCAALAEDVAARESGLSILVNNAGATWAAPLREHDERAWERVLALNVKAVSHLTRFLLPLLLATATEADPARVINVGSIEGMRVPAAATFAYSTSKAAVHHLTRHLAASLAPSITVNAIAPGAFPSRMMAATLSAHGAKIVKTVPMGRLGRADDVAGAALFLASRAGSYVTGTVLTVDGGVCFASSGG